MGILVHQTATRFKNSDGVFTHSFDSAAGWESGERESRRSLVSPPDTPIRSRQRNLLTRAIRRRRWPAPAQTLVAVILSCSIGVTAVTLILGIHPALDKVTLRKDAAELVSLETRSRSETSAPAAPTPSSPRADDAGIKLVAARPAAISQPEAPKSSLTSSPEQKRNSDFSAAKKPRASRREPEGRLDRLRNPQVRRAVALAERPYEQRGLSSLLAGISRALGFSRD